MSVRMTHRERVLAAVDRQETDRPPIDFGGTLATSIVPSTYEKLKRHLGETHPTAIGWKRQQLGCSTFQNTGRGQGKCPLYHQDIG